MNIQHVVRLLLGAAVPFILTACAVIPPNVPSGRSTSASTANAVSTPGASPHSDTRVAELAKPDYRLSLQCSGQGGPTVVLDGMADGGQAAWEQAHVPGQVGAFARVCTYQRRGQPGTPLTSRQIAEDLHALLSEARVSGPAVIVGWLFGGLTARVYAAHYPAEVAGLVLVNSPEPGVEARLRALLPPESPDESASLQEWRRNLTGGNQQRLASLGVDNDASVAQAGAAGPFGAMPVVVVTTRESDYPPEVVAQFKPVWEEMQAKPSELSSNSKQIVIEQPWPQQPDVVVDAIRQVVIAARDKHNWDSNEGDRHEV